MKGCKISTKLFFSLLAIFSDMDQKNLLNYKELNKKVKNKIYYLKSNIKPQNISSQKIKDYLNCTGSAIFLKKQETYYTSLEKAYPFFYLWQSTVKNEEPDVWSILNQNLIDNNHQTKKESKLFDSYKDNTYFEKAVYKTYKKLTWKVSETKQ